MLCYVLYRNHTHTPQSAVNLHLLTTQSTHTQESREGNTSTVVRRSFSGSSRHSQSGSDRHGAAGSSPGGAVSGQRFSSSQGRRRKPGSDPAIIAHLVNAVKGLLRAVSLGTKRWSSSVTQDMLSTLSIWFKYGNIPEVHAALEVGLASVHIDNWLGVLPQLIARIDHPETNARTLLHELLTRVGTCHVQALVYPLSVAVKSPR